MEDILDEISGYLTRLYGADHALVKEWLDTPHPELNDRSSGDLMREGKPEVVRDMLAAARLGIPT